MTDNNLIERVKHHEDNFVERKPDGANRSEIRKSVVAFANSVPVGRTGVVFFGVHNDGKIQGVSNPDQLQKTVREVCEQDCYPAIKFSSEVIYIDDKSVVAVIIPPSADKPHFAGPAYVRRGSQSVIASKELFEELILSRNDKCAAMLKNKGQIVTVIAQQHHLGDTKIISDSQCREYHECRIESCDAHVLHLTDINTDRSISEPLQNVTISYDNKKYRPMLIITGNK